jgi:hypothetical protein
MTIWLKDGSLYQKKKLSVYKGWRLEATDSILLPQTSGLKPQANELEEALNGGPTKGIGRRSTEVHGLPSV